MLLGLAIPDTVSLLAIGVASFAVAFSVLLLAVGIRNLNRGN